MESVASMDTSDINRMSLDYGNGPYLIDAKDFGLARRPRLYWFDWELLPEQGVDVGFIDDDGRRNFVVSTQCEVNEQDYLTPGWHRVVAEPLPTFTTSRCRESPGRRPAGLYLCQSHEITRWKNDLH